MPDYAEVHFYRGNTLQSLGHLNEALASYELALQIVPDYAEAHSARGAVLHNLGRIDEAMGNLLLLQRL